MLILSWNGQAENASKREKRKRKRKDKSQAYVEEKKVPVTNKPKKNSVIKTVSQKKENTYKDKKKKTNAL